MFAELVAEDPSNAGFQAYVYLATSQVQSRAGDLNGALDSALQGIRIDQPVVVASPANAFARNTLAQLYSQLGASRAALANRTGATKQTAEWQAARDADQKSLDIYLEMKSKGTLSSADSGKPEELAKAIAECDAALKSK